MRVPHQSVPFLGNSGPLYPATEPLSHELEIRFYLDEIGDAIWLDNSAWISHVPEPTSGLLLLLGTACSLAARRRRRGASAGRARRGAEQT